MPRYLVERVLGDITAHQMDRTVEASTRIREDDFPEIGWEHSHVVHDPNGGLTAFCVYAAPEA